METNLPLPLDRAAAEGSAASVLRAVGETAREGVGTGAARGREEGAPLDISFLIPGEPKGKGRHRSRIAKMGNGKQFIANYAPKDTVEYENLVRMAASDAMDGRAPSELPVLVEMVATCSVPASWSQKKRHAAIRGEVMPTGKPDLDNGLKAVLDGLNKIVVKDDAQVCRVGMSKQYGERPGVFVRVVELHARPAR
ncbi:RusA family crossover junction endodeoxyribonuclease [Aromatoleum toluolicum]|uniref:RusA family crossover junction endodeoxyribonuclease n=1 Tax=Aromatoleum toluolicum TaxID=90060 RepID=A0ABX1NGZ5_9RHOO|nr:RusA family crossover junction endodeoxyribonuclease [Aromatoleum toluolicum]NMF98405.1 RusA family crossover junction endodeoxyribonuclease [Aromatoleum toluolicum]